MKAREKAREKAASFVLCNDNIAEALELLENASSISDTIPDEVIVWEKFELEPIENLMGIIENLEDVITDFANQRVIEELERAKNKMKRLTLNL